VVCVTFVAYVVRYFPLTVPCTELPVVLCTALAPATWCPVTSGYVWRRWTLLGSCVSFPGAIGRHDNCWSQWSSSQLSGWLLSLISLFLCFSTVAAAVCCNVVMGFVQV
jgi:hypothetical protein